MAWAASYGAADPAAASDNHELTSHVLVSAFVSKQPQTRRVAASRQCLDGEHRNLLGCKVEEDGLGSMFYASLAWDGTSRFLLPASGFYPENGIAIEVSTSGRCATGFMDPGLFLPADGSVG
jgi:hypothetical protein